MSEIPQILLKRLRAISLGIISTGQVVPSYIYDSAEAIESLTAELQAAREEISGWKLMSDINYSRSEAHRIAKNACYNRIAELEAENSELKSELQTYKTTLGMSLSACERKAITSTWQRCRDIAFKLKSSNAEMYDEACDDIIEAIEREFSNVNKV